MKTSENQRKNTVPPAVYILGTTFLVGGIAGVAGFYGGFLLYPDSNLAPLLYLPTGGAGILVGMVLGIALSAFRKTVHSLHIEFRWLAAVWALTLSVSIVLDCDLLFVSLQILPPLLGLIMLTNKRLRLNIPKKIRRLWPVCLLAALLFLITSLFPPVNHNKWMPVEMRPVYTESNPMPKFLFCNSLRLDASRSYAELGVDSSQLLLEWLGITAVTGLLSAWFAKNRSRHDVRNSPPFITETEKSQGRIEKERPTANCGRWALWLYLGLFLTPLFLLVITEVFRIGSLALHCVFFMVLVGLPCCLASFVLGIIGLIRKEHPIKPAITSVAFSIGPVIFGLWVLWNYLTMGEPW